jgi:hypothetical protein
MDLRHVEDVLEDHGHECAVGLHTDRNTAYTSGLYGTVVTEDDVYGWGEWGVIVEPVTVRAHVLGCTRVNDPPVHEVTWARLGLGLQDMFMGGVQPFDGRSGGRSRDGHGCGSRDGCSNRVRDSEGMASAKRSLYYKTILYSLSTIIRLID